MRHLRYFTYDTHLVAAFSVHSAIFSVRDFHFSPLISPQEVVRAFSPRSSLRSVVCATRACTVRRVHFHTIFDIPLHHHCATSLHCVIFFCMHVLQLTFGATSSAVLRALSFAFSYAYTAFALPAMRRFRTFSSLLAPTGVKSPRGSVW